MPTHLILHVITLKILGQKHIPQVLSYLKYQSLRMRALVTHTIQLVKRTNKNQQFGCGRVAKLSGVTNWDTGYRKSPLLYDGTLFCLQHCLPEDYICRSLSVSRFRPEARQLFLSPSFGRGSSGLPSLGTQPLPA